MKLQNRRDSHNLKLSYTKKSLKIVTQDYFRSDENASNYDVIGFVKKIDRVCFRVNEFLQIFAL